jgi:hypothetical protein
MIRAFIEDQGGALAGRQDILLQVLQIDPPQDFQRRLAALFVGKAGVAVKIGIRMLECGRTFASNANPISGR